MSPYLGEVRVESGSWGAIRSARAVAIVAHWSEHASVSRSTVNLLQELRLAGYGTALVSTAQFEGPLELPAGAADLVLRRPNVGYDFGSWASSLRAGGESLLTRPLVLANDSLVGPFHSLRHAFDHADETGAHVWGLVASGQFGWHLQSFFLRFAPGVLAHPVVGRFWSSIRDLGSKDRVIRRYELGLSKMLYREGFRMDSYVPVGLACSYDRNPMIVGWRGVMDAGLPLVKRELIRDPDLAEDGHEVAAQIAARYSQDVREWV